MMSWLRIMSYNPDFVIHIFSAFTTEQLSQTHNSLIDWLKKLLCRKKAGFT